MKNNQIFALVVHAIDRAQSISYNRSKINLYQTDENGLIALNQRELLEVLKSLQTNEKVVKITFLPANLQPKPFPKILENLGDFNYFSLEIMDNFQDLITQIPKPKLLKKVSRKVISDSEIVSVMSLNDVSVYLDDKYLIAKTNYDSSNYNAIKYILENPNRKITGKELKEKAGVNKNFTTILDQLNFKGDLRKAFFEASKTAIILHNPLKSDRVKSLGINMNKILSYKML